MTDSDTTPSTTAVDPALADDGRYAITGIGGTRRRGARWLVVVAIVLVVAELAARVVMASVPDEIRWYDASMQLRVATMDQLAEGADGAAVDVVFAGPSSAWQALVPRTFESVDPSERSAFNVGLDGGVPVVAGPWLLDHVEPRLQPELIVWGLTPLDLAPGFGDAPAAAYDESIAARTDWLAELDRTWSSASELVRSRRTLRDPDALFGTSADEREHALDSAAASTGAGGERLDFEPDLSEDRERVNRARLADFSIDEDDRDVMIDALIRLRHRGVEVVLLELPMPQRFRDLMPEPGADSRLVSDEIARIADRTGAHLIRMPRALSDIDFVDYTHVDQAAAAEVTTWVTDGLVLLDSLGRGACADLGVVDQFGFAIPVEVCAA